MSIEAVFHRQVYKYALGVFLLAYDVPDHPKVLIYEAAPSACVQCFQFVDAGTLWKRMWPVAPD